MAKVDTTKLKRENELLRQELKALREQQAPRKSGVTPAPTKIPPKTITFDFKYLKKDLIRTFILTAACTLGITTLWLVDTQTKAISTLLTKIQI